MTNPPPFSAPWSRDDVAIARELMQEARAAGNEAQVDRLARRLIEAIRRAPHGFGGVEDMLREFSLSTPEGLALMVLAEALLRVPDTGTADLLIEDKLEQGDFAHHVSHSDALLVTASAWALGLSARLIQPGETPDGILSQLAKRIGLPALRTATRQAMRLLGDHFVLGETIEAALSRAQGKDARVYRYSFDMLGEGARTADDAKRYFDSYAHAIEAIGRSAGTTGLPERPGISVKVSALHPRYEAVSRERVLREITPRLLDLARAAKAHDLNLTVDAEEADRLELSLDVIGAVLPDPSLAGWEGFGLAVQAYQKRARDVIEWVGALAQAHDRRLMVRLVKGAYWDTEIKRAQERGLDDYPVFTRKAMTDLNYVACAQQLLAARPRLYPQFATHNALTVATIIAQAKGVEGYEFQRLHGMGDALYRELMEAQPQVACRTYAPVGHHRELLAYLVRRLLENGANSSFVSAAADPQVPVESLLKRPAAVIGAPERARHAHLPLPRDLYGTQRVNSRGVEFGHRASLAGLQAEIASGARDVIASAIIDGGERNGVLQARPSPIDGTTIGRVREADAATADEAIGAARAGFRAWSTTPVAQRSAALRRAADLLEQRRGRFLHLLQVEGGKTLDDAVAEVREAADFCRYYATEAERIFTPQAMPGPTGESNALALRARGVFVAISPWNFPLAIFTGQIAAALGAGNAVVAKPAEQTPLVAHEMVRLLHEAGVSVHALQFVPGAGEIGARLVAHPDTAGVVFTGSTEVARLINRALAAKDGPIVPLIAETGGINAMIVDATALPEQVTDDVITSAFRSAGQRCSALRLLCLQDDVADGIIDMIVGAARELRIGDPRAIATHLGPVIDAEAKGRLEEWVVAMRAKGFVRFAGEAPDGLYVAPHVVELPSPELLDREVFGPVLHMVRWRAGELDALLQALEAKGYGLTLGVHSRIDAVAEHVAARMSAGNIYVNRNMIGAVVGTQPFGGTGLSGTGPKAGGPHYLTRFTTEQTLTINTAAAGGNASLIGMQD